jgi:polyferredoxin
VVVAALVMRAFDVSGIHASLTALAFGAVGLGIMALVSRNRGYMAHCAAWCPLGLVAALGGKLSPFRIRIDDACTDCGGCTSSCRYDALRPEHVRRRSPGINCTLCGDCLASCRGGFIGYRFPWLSPGGARAAFIALVAALHAVFLGVARI